LFCTGVAIGIPRATYLLICWSASPKQGRSLCLVAWEPFWFLHIMQCGEAICGLGVWGCCSFASSWWFFLPGVSPVSQQDLCWVWNSHYLLPPSSCHLGTFPKSLLTIHNC
jgi:hypothetical protein